MVVWSQFRGELIGPDGSVWGKGYSGAPFARNNPDMQNQPNAGPIPRGGWTIGDPEDSPHTGPFTLPLMAAPETETFGRNLFRIHGDSAEHPGTASHGCIILPRPVRERIHRENTDRALLVIL